jgi:hypothetical protein
MLVWAGGGIESGLPEGFMGLDCGPKSIAMNKEVRAGTSSDGKGLERVLGVLGVLGG